MSRSTTWTTTFDEGPPHMHKLTRVIAPNPQRLLQPSFAHSHLLLQIVVGCDSCGRLVDGGVSLQIT